MTTILNLQPLNLAEAAQYLKEEKEGETKKPVHAYFKKFSKLKLADAQKLTAEIKALNSVKMKETHIVKIVDFLPRDAEDVNKIFSDVSLSEEEINSILQIVKNY
ncbi:MAG: hypothetical protein AABX11_05435 [Nanoarchaeota archaeon]